MNENERERVLLVRGKLEEAIDNAQVSDELEGHEVDTDKLLAAFLDGFITRREFDFYGPTHKEAKGAAVFDAPDDFSLALQFLRNPFGLSEERIQSIMVEEMPHYATAQSFGLSPRLRIQFYKNQEGLVEGFYPQTSFHFPQKWADDQVRSVLKQIIEAPGTLSRRDKRQLGQP